MVQVPADAARQTPVQAAVQAPVQTPVQADGEAVALQTLVRVLQEQLAKAEARVSDERARGMAAETRAEEATQHLQAERRRTATAEDQVRELRRVVDADLADLRAALATVQDKGHPAQQTEGRTQGRPLLARLRDLLAQVLPR